MKRIRTMGTYLFALAISAAMTSAQQERTGLRNVYEDSKSVLQTWNGPSNEQEYVFSGKKSGLSVALSFAADTPNEAKISLGAGRSLSVQSTGDRNVVSLLEATGSDISVMYDLDANGTWEARISRSGKCEIFWGAAWHQVTELSGLAEGIPHARMGDVAYEFSIEGWKPINKQK
jgi:hypothetical protein